MNTMQWRVCVIRNDERVYDISNYIKGPMWEAFPDQDGHQPVLLIDEIDKADIEFK
jgi:MoxR-like ATPase